MDAEIVLSTRAVVLFALPTLSPDAATVVSFVCYVDLLRNELFL